jgi:hypothetical protein
MDWMDLDKVLAGRQCPWCSQAVVSGVPSPRHKPGVMVCAHCVAPMEEWERRTELQERVLAWALKAKADGGDVTQEHLKEVFADILAGKGPMA